jgi:two-component system, NtrC family, response regulator GlrR
MIHATQPHQAGQKILTVDDDPDILMLLGMRLTAAGYQVMSANNGEEALAQIALNAPALVITDLRMPGMDGLALFDAIHAIDPTLPVILLTAHVTTLQAENATQRGLFGFLTKPFDSKHLIQQIEAALHRGTGKHTTANLNETQFSGA